MTLFDLGLAWIIMFGIIYLEYRIDKLNNKFDKYLFLENRIKIEERAEFNYNKKE